MATRATVYLDEEEEVALAELDRDTLPPCVVKLLEQIDMWKEEA